VKPAARRPALVAIAIAMAMVIVLGASNASAQGDPVAAQALFDEAKLLIRKGDWAAACPKLAESERLDPGVGTLLNLAECYDHVGRTARAWATFREAEAMALHQGQSERSRWAAARAKQLEGKLVRLTIDVPDAARVAGLEVSRDHEVQAAAVWGVAVPIDPGDHVIEARAPGYKPFLMHVVAARDPVVVQVPPLEAEPAPAPTPTPPPVVEAPAPPPVSPPAPALPLEPVLPSRPPATLAGAPVDGGPMRTSGFVLGGVGLAGIGVGSLLGVFAIDRDNAARSAGCGPTTCPTQGGVDLTHQAGTFATAANATFLVSAVLLGTGILFVVVAPRSAPARAARALLSPWSFQ
jgi:hypothetical protein